QVNDGTTNSGTQNVSFAIPATDDAPVLGDTTGPMAVTELTNAAAQNLVPITGNFSVLDLDVGDTLTPSIVGSPVVQLKLAAFVLPAGASAPTAAGAFTLTGATSNGASVNIGYRYVPAAANLHFIPTLLPYTTLFRSQVNDGTTNSGTQNV